MEFKKLIDRTAEIERVTEALQRVDTQFIVIYGRRRIGKSTLIKHIVNKHNKAIYFLGDTSSETIQRAAFALFLKESPVHISQNIKIVLPEEIMKV